MRARVTVCLALEHAVLNAGDIIDGDEAILRVSEGLADPLDNDEPETADAKMVEETATDRPKRK
jgi:hypothetical protein